MLFKLVLTFALAAPDHAAALRAALALEEKGDIVAAATALARLIDKAPAYDLARIEAGRILLSQGASLDLAQAHLDAARSLAPENPRAHYLWGLLMDERHDGPEAVRAFETALLLRDDYPEARFRLAGLYFTSGLFEQSAAAWKRYAESNPGVPGPRLQLAAALERAGHPGDAEKELKKLYAGPKSRELASRALAEFYERRGRTADAARVRKDAGQNKRKLRDLLPSKR